MLVQQGSKKPRDINTIGETFEIIHEGEKHIVLRTYSGFVSLNDPMYTWSKEYQDGMTKEFIRFIDVEWKVLD